MNLVLAEIEASLLRQDTKAIPSVLPFYYLVGGKMGDFLDKVTGLSDFLTRTYSLPPWNGILVFTVGNNYDALGRILVSQDELFGPEDFESIFSEIMSRRLPWINMSCYGIYKGDLIVGVELPARENNPASSTSVNYSGPPQVVAQNSWNVDKILAVE